MLDLKLSNLLGLSRDPVLLFTVTANCEILSRNATTSAWILASDTPRNFSSRSAPARQEEKIRLCDTTEKEDVVKSPPLLSSQVLKVLVSQVSDRAVAGLLSWQ